MTEPTLPEESLFLRALELGSAEEQAAFLDRECGANADLRRSVEALLRHHREGSGFLESPPTEVVVAGEQLTAEENETPALDFLNRSEEPASIGRLGHYEILELLGSGGFGVVLKARDAKLDRIVAVKTLAQSLASSATARRRFVREAKAAAAVRHENVVGIYHVSDESPIPYLVMECVSGVSLETKLQQVGMLDVAAILRIGMQVASGLAAAHQQGLVHRDVKPGNILLENGVERVRITDFGLARAANDAAITRTGDVAGTPQYMSPEQALGQPVDVRSDLFSLGSVLYAMCTGRSPFRAETTIAALRRVCDDTPRPIREVNPEIPDWLVAIIDRLLAKNPADRFQTAAEVADLLSQHLAHLQHPTLTPLPVIATTTEQKQRASVNPRTPRLQRLPVALTAGALVCLTLSLGLAEATGVTHLSSTVIRVFTPSGTLVVEADDPALKVTVEGDGGLVITGAGPQEVRLKPGSYKVRADKDGKPVPLDQELVTITRAGKQLVRVRREHKSDSLKPPANESWHASSLGFVHDIAFSQDGRGVACAGNIVFLFDPATGQMLQRMEGHKHTVRSVAFSPDGRWVASGAQDNTVRIWDPSTGRQHRRFDTERASDAGFPFSFVAFSPEGTHLLAGSRDDLLMWEWESDAMPKRFVGHTKAPRRIAFSPDGKLVASCGHDGTARLWRADTGELLRTVSEGSDWIVFADFSPDGTLLATGGRQVTLWDVETGQERWHYSTGGDWAEGMSFTPDGHFLLAAVGNFEPQNEGKLVILDTLTGREVERTGGLSGYIFDVTISADGRDVFIGENAGMRRRRLPQSLWPLEQAELGAFALLAAGKDRRFGTLADAVLAARDGDTIEIRGNGPFQTSPITIRRPLVIRAGAGYAPVIRLRAGETGHVLLSSAPLVLEGLEIQYRLEQLSGELLERDLHQRDGVVRCDKASLTIANCRLIGDGKRSIVQAWMSPGARIANSELLNSAWDAVSWNCNSPARLTIDNCILAAPGTGYLTTTQRNDGPTDYSVRISRCTSLMGGGTLGFRRKSPLPDSPEPGNPDAPRLAVELIANVLDARHPVVNLAPLDAFMTAVFDLPSEKRNLLLPKLFAWREQYNLYRGGNEFCLWVMRNSVGRESRSNVTRDEWAAQFQLQEAHSRIGQARFKGGDLRARLAADPLSLAPDDFRLQADSPGYRAGPEGKDLGADVDLVGPGEAYERWKKTPEYQDWLKETGQLRAEAPKLEPQPFVVIGGKGVAERKFATLAEAAQVASDGDTVEVRGNGQFVSKPVPLNQKSLIIRAGNGFRPLIKLDSDEPGKHLISSNARLVVEGLDLQWVDAIPAEPGSGLRNLIVSWGPKAQLHAANCRFLMSARNGAHDLMNSVAGWNTPICRLRNCQSLIAGNGKVAGTAFHFGGVGHGQVILENCLVHGPGLHLHLSHADPRSAILRRNTMVAFLPVQFPLTRTDALREVDSLPLMQIEMSANILATPVISFSQTPQFLEKEQALSASEAEQFLKKAVAWHGSGNLFFKSEAPLLAFSVGSARLPQPATPVKTLDDWKRFWGLERLDTELEQPKFQGGDLVAKAALTPELVTPNDFRLREDSPGHRAGEGGQDLGADVDVVGPGEAYERWKKTPEYQEWLKETNRSMVNGP